MCRFKSEFSNTHQHDCHELLTFLLDGLHEVLNRASSPQTVHTVMEGIDEGSKEQRIDEKTDEVLQSALQGSFGLVFKSRSQSLFCCVTYIIIFYCLF